MPRSAKLIVPLLVLLAISASYFLLETYQGDVPLVEQNISAPLIQNESTQRELNRSEEPKPAVIQPTVSDIESTIVSTSGLWDVEPTPLQDLEARGIVPTVDAISEVLVSQEQPTELRVLAAYALAQLGHLSSLETLLKAAEDLNGDVRSAAISTLWVFRSQSVIPMSESVVPLLDQVVRNDILPEPRLAAVYSLTQIGTPEAAFALVHVANNESEQTPTRITALTGLGVIKSEDSAKRVAHLTRHENADIKGNATLILVDHGFDEYMPMLIDVVMDRNLDIMTHYKILDFLDSYTGNNFVETAMQSADSGRWEVAKWWGENESNFASEDALTE